MTQPTRGRPARFEMPDDLREVERTISRVLAHDTDRFAELVELAGLDPTRDFVGADMRGMDLTGERFFGYDFRGADFTGCDLEGASFEGAHLEGATFDEGVVVRLGNALALPANDHGFTEIAGLAAQAVAAGEGRIRRAAAEVLRARHFRPEILRFVRGALARLGSEDAILLPAGAETPDLAARPVSDGQQRPTTGKADMPLDDRNAQNNALAAEPAGESVSESTRKYLAAYLRQEKRIRIKAAQLLIAHEAKRRMGSTALQEDIESIVSYAWVIILERQPDFRDDTSFVHYFFRRMENYCKMAFRRHDARGALHEELDPDQAVVATATNVLVFPVAPRPDEAAERQSRIDHIRALLQSERPSLVSFFNLFVSGLRDVGGQAAALGKTPQEIYDLRERLRRFLAQHVDIDA